MPMHDKTDVLTRKQELPVSCTEFQYGRYQGSSKAVNVNETVHGVELTFLQARRKFRMEGQQLFLPNLRGGNYTGKHAA